MNKNGALLTGSKPIVIKRDSQRLDSAFFGRILKHQILSAEEKAREISNRAAVRAENLIAEAETEAENIRRAAYESGREESVRELLEDVLAAREERMQALHSIEEEVLKLAVKIAGKIIGREVEADEKTRAEIVSTALRQARQQEMLTVRVNAADLPLVEKMRERAEVFGRARYLDFVADPAVGAGGCLIESASGTIDARLETQLRVLETALLAQMTNEPEKI